MRERARVGGDVAAIFERHRIGWHRAASAGIALDRVAQCLGKLVRLNAREYG